MGGFITRWMIAGSGPYAEAAVRFFTSLRDEGFVYSTEQVQNECEFSYLLYVGSLPFEQQQQAPEEELHHFLNQWMPKCKESPANAITLLLARPFLPGTVQRITQLFRDRNIEISVASFPLLGLKMAAGQSIEWNPPAFIIGTTEEGKTLKHLRRELVRSGCPVMLMSPREAEMLNYLYINESTNRAHIQQLAGLPDLPKYDWVTILRGLGLHPQIGQQFFCADDVPAGWICRMVEKHVVMDNQSKPVIAIWQAGGTCVGEIRNRLEQMGCQVQIYCPETKTKRMTGLDLSLGKWQTLNAAQALVIVERHKEFSQLMLAEWETHLQGKHSFPLIIDCCGLYEPEEITTIGCRYISFGREIFETF
ncbi:hypothetical protein PP175_00665 [Aneurinibacillus sp. Ricciae_BoGa-3]|uniref:hypothetical protein n=1 Tax=Aneurinibacillus sp. Ricciae_BoGa-3 TaxID=3022697 RepID=UPI002342099A|nr:hypothetical protein [Aneurinibacillus sp. Ricciae_BoGa-3]WCK54608.1 hypothetical protein PP175_00665 [Aneurinibacillus sp. Ricciae_BoGa-3]